MRLLYLVRLSLSLALFLASLLPAAVAQTGFGSNSFGPTIHGVPPSVTSFGFGGSPGFHGVAPSVTSLNFGRTPFRSPRPIPFGFRHRRNPGFLNPFFGGVVAVPYGYSGYVMEPGVDDSMEEEDYRGGPTIFDRRGSGERDYRTPERVRDRERREREQLDQETDNDLVASRREPAMQQDVIEQPRTVLVFKDGHALEVLNYAIVGTTLYDLSDGRTRKVALAELDLPATVKQNDSRGVDFRVPIAAALN
jgi:hypothetical protein